MLAGKGLHQIGRAHADGGGSRQHQLDDVLRRGDAAHTYNGDFHRLVDLIHHPHRQRQHSRPRHSSGAVGQQRAAPLQVDSHPRQGIDEADAIRPRVLTGFRHGGDIRRCGGQL